MSMTERVRARFAVRGWPVAEASPRLLAYAVIVEVVAVAALVAELTRVPGDLAVWAKAVLLIGLAMAFAEGSARAARLRIRLKSDLNHDMTSVWSFAAVVALPAGAAGVVLVAVMGFIWWRQERPTGQALYRTAFNVCNALLACLVAAGTYRAVASVADGRLWTLAGAAPVLVAILVYTLVNRLLATGALLCLGVRGPNLAGTRNANLVEFATFCLGGLVALAIEHEPLLAVLVVAPLVALQRGALANELEAVARSDPKTGLLNAVAWEQIAQTELKRAGRRSTSVAVLIIDIDRFKLVNDHHGHLAGDTVLKHVGRRLEGGVREYDTVGRFGGEEFVAVLPDADSTDALIVAERLRASINEMRIGDLIDGISGIDDDHLPLSVSIGVAWLPPGSAAEEIELSDLLRDADAALYRAKAGGRNRVVLAGDGGTGPDARLPLA